MDGPSGFHGQGDWEWGHPQGGGPDSAYSGVYCWGTNLTGFYSNNAEIFLFTPALFLEMPDAYIRFASWYDFQEGEDGGLLKISLDGGSTWDLLEPVGGYPSSFTLPSGEETDGFRPSFL